jgi:hypothetical protein
MRCFPALVLVLLFIPALALGEEQKGIGFFKSVNGVVEIVSNGSRQQVSEGDRINASDSIITGKESSAAVVFQDGTRLTLAEFSEVDVLRYQFVPQHRKYDFSLFLKKGSMIYSTGKLGKLAPQKIELRTPRAIVGVRGTKCLLSVN